MTITLNSGNNGNHGTELFDDVDDDRDPNHDRSHSSSCCCSCCASCWSSVSSHAADHIALAKSHFLAFYISNFAMSIGVSTFTALIPISLRNLGESDANIGLIVALMGVGRFIAEVPIVMLSLRFGPWKISLFSMIALAAVYTLPTVELTAWSFIVAQAFAGIFFAGYATCRHEFLQQAFKKSERSRISGHMGAIGRVSYLVAPICGGTLMQHSGSATAYGVGVGFLVITVGTLFSKELIELDAKLRKHHQEELAKQEQQKRQLLRDHDEDGVAQEIHRREQDDVEARNKIESDDDERLEDDEKREKESTSMIALVDIERKNHEKNNNNNNNVDDDDEDVDGVDQMTLLMRSQEMRHQALHPQRKKSSSKSDDTENAAFTASPKDLLKKISDQEASDNMNNNNASFTTSPSSLCGMVGTGTISTVFFPVAAREVDNNNNKKNENHKNKDAIVEIGHEQSENLQRKVDEQHFSSPLAAFKVHWKNVIGVGFIVLSVMSLRQARKLTITLRALNLGYASRDVGIILAASFAVDATLFWVSSTIVNKYGYVWSVTPLFFMYALAFLTESFEPESGSSDTLFLSLPMFGIGDSFGAGITVALISEMLPRALVGVTRIALDFGVCAGPLFTGFLAHNLGLSKSCWGLCAWSVVGGIAAILMLRGGVGKQH